MTDHYNKKHAEVYWSGIGAVINNNKSMLMEARRIYRESQRLPYETKPRTTQHRIWYCDLITLIRSSWGVLRMEDPSLPQEPMLVDEDYYAQGRNRYDNFNLFALLNTDLPALTLWEYVYMEAP